jgi:hypothetical protein
MSNAYISNRGITKTIVSSNNQKNTNEFLWDANYDGNVANIKINTNENGKHRHYNYSLNNTELEDILNMESINIPLEKRLETDFDEDLVLPLSINKYNKQTKKTNQNKITRHKIKNNRKTRNKTKSKRATNHSKRKFRGFTLF